MENERINYRSAVDVERTEFIGKFIRFAMMMALKFSSQVDDAARYKSRLHSAPEIRHREHNKF
jgi:hypothetical protein